MASKLSRGQNLSLKSFSDRFLLFWLALPLLILLAACGGGDEDKLPTVIQLPELPSPEQVFLEGSGIPPTEVSRSTLPPTWTVNPSETQSSTPTVTPSLTITDTPTNTLTATPSETVEPNAIGMLADLAAGATVLPPEYLPTVPSPTPTFAGTPISPVNPSFPTATAFVPTSPSTLSCSYQAPGGFAAVMQNNTALAQQIGCPVGAPPQAVQLSGAGQAFEHGGMAWIGQSPAQIYVLFADGSFQRFNDTFQSGVDPDSGGLTPPAGLLEPVRGFGKVWRESSVVQTGLGWATAPEVSTPAALQEFNQGLMMYLPARGDVLVFVYSQPGVPTSGSWVAVPGQY